MDVKKIKDIKVEVFTVPMEEKKEKNKPSFFHIDRDMIRFKAHFFIFIGAMGCVLPYFPIVARNRINMSATSLAAVLTSQQLLSVVSKPVIGYLADYFNKLKLMINTLLIIQTISFFFVLAIPPIDKTSTLSLTSQFKNWNDQDEFTILAARYYPHEKESPIEMAYSNLTANDSNNFYVDIICIAQINTTEMICFKQEIDQEMSDTQLHCSCSVIPSLLMNLTDIVDPSSGKMFYRLLSLEPQIFKLSEENLNFPCSIVLAHDSETSTDVNDFLTLQFWIFAFVTTISSTCVSSLFTLGDTACFETVVKVGGDFGKQRLFGAVGWGTLAAIGGLLCDVTGDYLAAWILMAVLQIIAVWNISKLDLVKPHFSQNLLKDVCKVLKSIEFAAFEFGVFFNGFGAGIMWFYLVWFISGLGGSTFLCGLVNYVQCFAGEIPFMYFSGWFIKKLGHFNLISLSLLCYALRFLWYSYLQNPWLVLPIEIVHGFTYGTFYPTVAAYGKKSAKPGTEATTQSILFTTHEGLGAGLGCILAGIGFDIFGGHQTFFYVSLTALCAAIFNILNTFLLNRRSSKTLTLASNKM